MRIKHFESKNFNEHKGVPDGGIDLQIYPNNATLALIHKVLICSLKPEEGISYAEISCLSKGFPKSNLIIVTG